MLNKHKEDTGNKSLIRIAQVVALEDELDTSGKNDISKNSFGRRIKVRLHEDKQDLNPNELPWVWPILPKYLQITPKIGEMVLVFFQNADGVNGNRYYVGPIISQDYYLDNGGTYEALSLLQGIGTKPLCHPSGNSSNDGSYPDSKTIAIQGRGDSAMWLKDEEVRLMCGHKPGWKKRSNIEHADPGSLEFNRKSLAYIQMKFGKFREMNTEEREFESVINVVADRIHLISHDGALKQSGVNLTDSRELMDDYTVGKFASYGQRMVYGDELVSFLEKFREVFAEHTHHLSNDRQVVSEKDSGFWNKDLKELLCSSIRIA